MQIEASVTFAANHPVFAGHFPGRPIVPGALLLDAVLHAAQQELRAAQHGLPDVPVTGPVTTPFAGPSGTPQAICQVASVKFLSPVQPGDTLVISCVGSPSGPTHFQITSQGRPVATGTFVLGSVK